MFPMHIPSMVNLVIYTTAPLKVCINHNLIKTDILVYTDIFVVFIMQKLL